MIWLKQSTAVTVQFGPFLDKTDGVTLEIGLATALDNATTGIRTSKNGGTLADRASATAPTYDAMGLYKVELGTSDTDTLGTLRIVFEEAATCLPVWQDFMVVPANVWDSLFGSDKLDVSVTEWLGIAVTAATVAGRPDVQVVAMNASSVTATAIATDAIGAAELATDAVEEIADQVWNEDATAHQTTGTFGQAIGDPVANTKTLYAALITDAVGASVTADVSTVDTVVDGIQTDLDNATDGLGAIKADTAAILTDTADMQPKLGTPAGTDISADIATVDTVVDGIQTDLDNATDGLGAIKTDTAAILVDTAVIGALGAGLTDITDRLPAALIKGTADSGTTTTVVDAARTEATDDWFKGQWIRFTSGTLDQQMALITDFTALSNTITFTPAVTTAVVTHTYEILPANAVAIDWGQVNRPTTAVDLSATDIQLCDTITTYTGNTPQTADHAANISTILTDTGTTLDDHLTDIKGTGFVKDTHSLVDIEAYADLIDDGTSGLAKIATDVAAILVDTASLNDTVLSELAVAAPSATPTLRNAIMLLYMALRNKETQTATTRTISNDAGTTIASSTVSDDGTTYTKGEFA